MAQTTIPTEELARTLVEGTKKGLIGWQTRGTELYSTQVGNMTVMVGRANTAVEVPVSVSVFDDQSNRLEKIDSQNVQLGTLVLDLYDRAVNFAKEAKRLNPAEIVTKSIEALKEKEKA